MDRAVILFVIAMSLLLFGYFIGYEDRRGEESLKLYFEDLDYCIYVDPSDAKSFNINADGSSIE